MAISFEKQNYSKGELNANITNSDTSFTLKTGQGDLFPATGSGNQFAGVFWSANQNNPFEDVNREIVHCYRDSGDTFQVNTRGAENTSASAWSMNDNFMLIASAAVFDDYETELDGKTAGPASSTDNAIVRFDGAGGKTVQNSGVIINDSDEVGLNEPSPLSQLHVTNDQAALTEVRLDNSNVSGSMAYTLFDGSNKRGQVHYDIASALLTLGTSVASGEVRINSANDVEALRIDSNGVVTLVTSNLDINDNDIQNAGDVDYTTASNTTSNLGNLGATETVDFNTNTSFRGTLDSNVTITVSNVSDGQRGSLILYYDGSAQRTITWSGVDAWIGGSEPDAPSVTNEPLVVTVWNDGNLTIASGGIAS